MPDLLYSVPGQVAPLALLSVSRRPACRVACFQGRAQPFPPLEVDRLDAIDRAAKAEVRRSGHTRVLASRPAKRAGRVVGMDYELGFVFPLFHSIL